MGMKPRKLPGINISASLREDIDTYASGLRELLKDYYKVPKERWQEALSVDSLEDCYPDFMDDRWAQWLLGWFRGVADALGCEADDLVVL